MKEGLTLLNSMNIPKSVDYIVLSKIQISGLTISNECVSPISSHSEGIGIKRQFGRVRRFASSNTQPLEFIAKQLCCSSVKSEQKIFDSEDLDATCIVSNDCASRVRELLCSLGNIMNLNIVCHHIKKMSLYSADPLDNFLKILQATYRLYFLR